MSSATRLAPFYLSVGNEREIFRAAFDQQTAIMLKGPTGVGKTRLVEAMGGELEVDVITVSCHEDLSAADLIGRHLLKGGETIWVDGPLTEAVRRGAICYLDEVVEARQDTTVILHALTDHRRMLTIERTGEILQAPPNFGLVISYNPGYQNLLKDLKDSTRQRFVGIELGFPPPEAERQIVAREASVDDELAGRLVLLGQAIRRAEVRGLREVASTRTLIAAGRLMTAGIDGPAAAWSAIGVPLTDDPSLSSGLRTLIDTYLG